MIHAYSKLSVLIIAFAALAMLVSCSSLSSPKPPDEGAMTWSVTDDLGRSVVVPVPLTRAVSLAPSLTEMVFAAGAGDRLVGVTSYCDFPAETAAIAKVGDTQSPNIESIVALQPQLVLVSTASQLESFTEVLDSQKIAVFVMDIGGVDDVPRGLRTLGDIFGTVDESEAAALDFERRIAAVTGERSKWAPKVFLQISNEPLFTIGKASYLTDLISRAGGSSVTRAIEGGYPRLSKETALAMDPEVIVLSDSEDNREPNSVFAKSRAVESGRVVRIDPDLLSRPGPRLADALEQLSRALGSKVAR